MRCGRCRGQGSKMNEPKGEGVKAGRGKTVGRGLGPKGECLCPQCGTIVPHERGIPCFEMKFPKCGSPMVRA